MVWTKLKLVFVRGRDGHASAC